MVRVAGIEVRMRPDIEERRPAGDEKLQERQHVSLADPELVLLLDTADAIERSRVWIA
jgi:hypothetical protein